MRKSFKNRKVLFFSNLQIQPALSGGQWRSLSLAKDLKKLGAEVLIYSLTGRKEDYLKLKKSGFSTGEVKEWVDRSIFTGFFQWASYRLKLPPLWIPLYLRFLCPHQLKKALRESDTLVVDFPYGSPLLKNFNGVKVFSSHNVEGDLWKNTFLSRWVKRIERKAVEMAEIVLHCSRIDKAFLSHYGSARFIYRSNRVPKNRFSQNSSREDLRKELGLPLPAKIILFSGSKFQPNSEALFFLRQSCQENAENLKKKGIQFLVVGSVSLPFKDDCVWGVGPVAKVEPYFLAADAAINPVVLGSGTNVKMFEYHAAGLPILSTDFGARGTGLKAGKDYHCFSRENFIDSLGVFAKEYLS